MLMLSSYLLTPGSRVWLVKTLEALPLGPVAAKPLHLRSTHTTARCSGSGSMLATALALLPGPNQQLLVGLSRGRVLKGACLGTPAPPREYHSAQWEQISSWAKSTDAMSPAADTDNAADTDSIACRSGSSSSSTGVQGSVTSIAVCPAVAEAWVAGYSCGSVALFSVAKSRPVLLWQQLRNAPVVAVRWVSELWYDDLPPASTCKHRSVMHASCYWQEVACKHGA
jgi:hypothetical protein